MSKLSSHERKDKVKWVITAIAFVLAFIMLAGVFMQVFLPEGKKPTDWFDKVENVEQEEETPDENGGAVITEQSSSGVKLMSARISPEDYDEYGVSTFAESAYTLTATITPAEATDKELIWAVDWNKEDERYSDDAWYSDGEYDYSASELEAIGLTVEDFVTIAPSEDTSQCVVSCNQGFGCPIEITVTSVDNPQAKATCSVDYRNRITQLNTSDNKLSLTNGSVTKTGTYSVYSSAGTISSSITVTTAVSGMVYWSDVFSELGVEADLRYGNWLALDSFYLDKDGNITNDSVAANQTFTTFSGTIYEIDTSFSEFVFKYMVEGTESLNSDQKKVVLEQVRNILLDSSVQEYLAENPVFRIHVELKNNDTKETMQVTKGIYLSDISGVSSFSVPVTNVNINKGSVIF